MTAAQRIAQVGSLENLYAELGGMEMTAGWIDRDEPILWREPDTGFRPQHWRYALCKPALDAAGRLINTELAERRNLVMRNPADPDGIATTRTLVSAYQMILPGEKARSHRHAPHALRVILDAKGAYSTVDGIKTPMDTGDIVLTPGWQWHGHGHDGDEPAYWFDGLDVPLVHLLEPMFVEDHPDRFRGGRVGDRGFAAPLLLGRVAEGARRRRARPGRRRGYAYSSRCAGYADDGARRPPFRGGR